MHLAVSTKNSIIKCNKQIYDPYFSNKYSEQIFLKEASETRRNAMKENILKRTMTLNI